MTSGYSRIKTLFKISPSCLANTKWADRLILKFIRFATITAKAATILIPVGTSFGDNVALTKPSEIVSSGLLAHPKHLMPALMKAAVQDASRFNLWHYVCVAIIWRSIRSRVTRIFPS